MEGRGKSRRRNTRQEWKRRLSSALAVVLTAAMVLNMPLSIDSLGLHVSNAFASGSNADREGGLWATASNAKYQKGQSQDVDIYVIAEDNEAAPGNTSSMTLYLKNNTGQTITEGTLSFKGNHIAKEDGYFEDMGTAQADTPTVIVGGEDPTKQTEASGEGMLYQEDGEDSKESIDGEASLGDQDGIAGGDDADADANDADDEDADDEDAEEEESHKLTDIDLQPGEMREIRFTYYTDDEENSTKAYVEFYFHGEDENEAAVRSSSKFYYSIGLPFVNFSMEDGMQIESGVSNDMEIWMSEPTWVDEALEERIEKQEEEEAEKAYKDEETEPADTASGSNADKASDSNASKDTEDADTQKDQDKINQYKEEAMTISKVSYDVEIYGAELERFSPRKAEEVEDLGWISCIYEVANNTEPGVYYGKVTANGRWNNRKFTSEQGFLFEVTGEGKTGQEFTKELDKVIVHAYAEEGVLEEGVKLTVEELAKGSEPFSRATEGLDNGDVQYDENNMLAFDICFVNKNGEEVEPNGDVQVSIEMKKDALPEDIDLETVEVHHIKEFDDTVEAEPVADGADKTDGTVKSAEVAVAELKEAEVDQEEIEAAVSDEAVAVAEFSVGSFSYFTITWQSSGVNFSININYVNEFGRSVSVNRDDIPGSFDVDFPVLPSADSSWNKLYSHRVSDQRNIDLEQYIVKTENVQDGGNFKGIFYNRYNGTAVTSITATVSGEYRWKLNWNGGKWQSSEVEYTLTFYNNDKIVDTITYSSYNNKANIYYVYEGEPVTPPQPSEGFGINVFKRADKLDDGNYQLTLSMTGDQETDSTPAAVDILFIVDRSGSMDDNIGDGNRGSRISAVQDAVKILVDSISEKVANDEVDANYSVVAFAGAKSNWQDYGTEVLTGWTSNAGTVTNAVNNVDVAGGTNWEKAIKVGKAQLEEISQLNGQMGRNAQTIVIFLSDGMPTYYGDNDTGNGNQNNMSYDEIEDCKDAAVEEVATMSCDRFYAIGIGPDFSSESKHGYKCMNDLRRGTPNGTWTAIYSANDTDTLTKAFNDIAASVTFFSCIDVVMIDQLSDWAELVETNGQVEFTIQLEQYDETQKKYVPISGCTKEQVKAGESVTFNDQDNPVVTIPVTITPRVSTTNSEGEDIRPTIEVAINGANGSDYEIQPGFRYTVKTTITQSQEALTAGETEYDGTGEADTGTHAGETGFYSNDENNAKVSYTVKDSVDGKPGSYEEEKEKPFPKPVIQVPEPKTGDLTIFKAVSGTDRSNVSTQNFVFNISAGTDVDKSLLNGKSFSLSNDTNESITFAQDSAQIMITGANSVTIKDLPIGTYTITEETPEDLENYYFVSKVSNPSNGQVNVPADGTGTITVTNTYAPYKSVILEKKIEGSMASGNDEFVFEITGTSVDNITKSEDDIVIEAGNEKVTIKMKGGRSVTINKLKETDSLTICETQFGNYTPSIDLSEVDGYQKGFPIFGGEDHPGFVVTGNRQVSIDVDEVTDTGNDNALGKVIYINTLDMPAPTGVNSTVLPYALMMAVSSFAGFTFISGTVARRRRKR